MSTAPNGPDPRDRTTILVHYYRAMVGRADTWRMRMDATTNWAIGATVVVSSFALGNADVPHYVVPIASLMTLSFLLLEARRLSFYHLWQQRVLLLEEGLIRPALSSEPVAADLATALDPHLGRTVPTMPLARAVARRLRRVYLYLFAVQLLAWMLKVSIHPTPASSFETWLQRAQAGPVPGPVVVALTLVALVAALALAWSRGGSERERA